LSEERNTSVHRYFELADSFVEVRQVDPDAVELTAPRSLDRIGYRRFVIQACMPQFTAQLVGELQQLFPEDPLLAEDLLYDLCVEVNPSLDIHTVRLREVCESAPPSLARAAEKSGASGDDPVRMVRVARNLERRLLRKIHGQNDAVLSVCQMVKKAAVGLSAPDRPLASFLFVGRTGTGKTELARRLAIELSDDPRSNDNGNLLRIDCSEFALAHEYSKLIGSPPGYVGHDEGGQLTKALTENPDTVVLFDEIEKAHPRMHHILLQILEEGALTDGRGTRVRFNRNFVILTSNAGAEEIQSATGAVGFHRENLLGDETLQAITERALANRFSPEFLGRLDRIVQFKELDLPAVHRIAAEQLTELAIRARRRGVKVAFTPAVARRVVSRGFSPEYGARELRHEIQREIEPRLAQLMLEQDVTADHLVRVRVNGGELLFEIED
jgi:ATP-dependent Clp protease ATP-binding subunit ClpC